MTTISAAEAGAEIEVEEVEEVVEEAEEKEDSTDWFGASSSIPSEGGNAL